MSKEFDEFIALAKRFPELSLDEIRRFAHLQIVLEDEYKALEIIKEKGVNLYKLKMCDSVEEYNKLCNSALPLTQEEYDLLKKVLK